MKYVDKLDKNSMFWLAVGNIPDKIKNAPAGGMMPVDLSKAEAFTAFVDYKGKTFSGEFRLISYNESGNKQIADMLNGLKSLGAMGSAKDPDLGQLLNSIQLSSGSRPHQADLFPFRRVDEQDERQGQGQGQVHDAPRGAGRAARQSEPLLRLSLPPLRPS